MRVMFDSNVFDKFLISDESEDENLIERVNRSIDNGKIIVLVTHIQRDELAATPDCKSVKRKSLLRVFEKLRVQLIPTSAMAWDVSRWDLAKWGEGSGEIKISQIQTKNKTKLNHTEDALITATASADADVLVTLEERLSKKIAALGTQLQVWSFDDFKIFLDLPESTDNLVTS